MLVPPTFPIYHYQTPSTVYKREWWRYIRNSTFVDDRHFETWCSLSESAPTCQGPSFRCIHRLLLTPLMYSMQACREKRISRFDGIPISAIRHLYILAASRLYVVRILGTGCLSQIPNLFIAMPCTAGGNVFGIQN